MTITISAEQAAALPDPFVVDGDEGNVILRHLPPAVFADADKECPGCDDGRTTALSLDWVGKPIVIHPQCAQCHGTGRTVVELVTLDVDGCTKSYISGDEEPYNIGTGCACHLPAWFATDPARGCDECSKLHDPLTLRSLGLFIIQVRPIIRHNWLGDIIDVPVGDPLGHLELPPDAEPGQYAVIVTRCE